MPSSTIRNGTPTRSCGSTAALQNAIKFGKVNYYVKESFSKDAAPELIEEIAARQRHRADGYRRLRILLLLLHPRRVALEKKGIPSVAIITTEFVRETELTLRAIGMQGLRPVVIDHPVSSITQSEIASRTAEVALQAPRIWLGLA